MWADIQQYGSDDHARGSSARRFAILKLRAALCFIFGLGLLGAKPSLAADLWLDLVAEDEKRWVDHPNRFRVQRGSRS